MAYGIASQRKGEATKISITVDLIHSTLFLTKQILFLILIILLNMAFLREFTLLETC